MGIIKYPEHMVFGLDIGTRTLVGTVGFRENEHLFRVAAQYTLEHETRAMLDGQIHDIVKVSESIERIKRELEHQIGRELNEVCIAAAGRVLKTITVRADLELEQELVVKQEHIQALDMLGTEKAYETMRKQSQTDDIPFYCVGYSVIHYYLNDYPMMKLEEHKASKISVELIATFLPEEVIDGLYAAVEGASLQVENLTLEPIAAMNVAIPEKYRLLNIALVDVGAGTSDICITKDGSVVAYGMIPAAGDEITEVLAKRYLVDFYTAEKIKQTCSKKKEIIFKDIMGLRQKAEVEEVLEAVEETLKTITRSIADKILELNGGKSVSAIFVVGGGGKIPGFTDKLADMLSLPHERVALRGEEVLQEVEFLQPNVKKDPLLVTPIGICYSYYESRNNFIYVHVNEERVKLYDNSKLTILDAPMKIGLPNEDLFPKRGKTIHFSINGTKRTIRGEVGEAAVITLNGNSANINTEIQKNDVIRIIPSTTGADASYEIRNLSEYCSTITFFFNNQKIVCPKFVQVNEKLVSEFYEIQDGDEIEILNYYTLEQILEFMDVEYTGTISINHVPALPDEKVYENFSIDCQIAEEEVIRKEEIGEIIHVIVNGTGVTLRGKKNYILVDVLDFYSFDISKMKGRGLIIKVNEAIVQGFMTPIKEGDRIQLYWDE